MSMIIRIRNSTMPPRKKMKNNESGSEVDLKDEREKYKIEDMGSEWRQKLKGVREFNNYALHNKILSDVTFEVGPDQTKFYAHRLILALGSPVFEAMFYGGLAEKGDTIPIPDIAPEGFHCLLRYIYTEKIFFDNENEAFKTSTAADKYCIPVLKEACEKYIYKSQLSSDNVWILFENALFMGMTTILERCLEFLKENSKLALKSSSFLDTSAETVEKVLQLDSIDVIELVILQSIIRWAEHKSTFSEEGKSVKELLEPLLKHIRFGALNAEEFCCFLEERSNLLTDTDALAIMKHLIRPSACSLPEWCCTRTWRSLNLNHPSGSGEKSRHRDRKSASRDRSSRKSPSRKKGNPRKIVAKFSSESSSDGSSSSSDFSSLCSSDSDSYV